MLEHDPTSDDLDEQPSTSPTDPSEQTNDHTNDDSQNQAGSQISTCSSFSSIYFLTSSESSLADVNDASSNNNNNNNNYNEQHVRFRSHESIRFFNPDSPLGTAPDYPDVHRHKKKLRKKPTFPQQADVSISSGRSILKTRGEDAARESHSGKYGRAEDSQWKNMIRERRAVSKLQRSNTVPSSNQRSRSKDEASGVYRLPSTTFDFMLSREHMDGGQARVALPIQPTASSSSAKTMNSSSVASSSLKHRSIPTTSTSTRYPSQSQIYQSNSSAQQSHVNIAAAESRSTHQPQIKAGDQNNSRVASRPRSRLDTVGKESKQEDNVAGVAPAYGSSRSTSLSPSSQPTSSMPSLRQHSTRPLSLTPGNPIQVPQAADRSSQQRRRPTSSQTKTTSQFPSMFHDPVLLAFNRQATARLGPTQETLHTTEDFSCSSPQRQQEMEQEQRRTRLRREHARRESINSNTQAISQFLTLPQDLDQSISSLSGSPSRHSAPGAILSRTPCSRHRTPILPSHPNMVVMSRQRSTLATPPLPDTEEAGATGGSNSPSGSNGRGIRIGTAGGATLENSSTLLSSGPHQSNFLVNPSLEDLPLFTRRYHLPKTTMVSPILHAVMTASQGVTSNKHPFSSGEKDEDDDVIAFDLNSESPVVNSNAPWEVNAGLNSSHSHPQTPRTASEIVRPRTASEIERPRTASEIEERHRGKQTDRSIRQGQEQNQDLGNQEYDLDDGQVHDTLHDHYIDEEQIIDVYYYNYGTQGYEENEAEVGGNGAVAGDDTQRQIGNGEGKEKETLLQRLKRRLFVLTKPKKTPKPA